MEELIADSTGTEPDTFAHNSWSVAAQRALAKGLPITISHEGLSLRIYPDGRVEEIAETSAQVAAREEMGRLDFSRFELPDVKVPPAFREIAETITALASQGREIVDAITERAKAGETPVWTKEDTSADAPSKTTSTSATDTPSHPALADELTAAASGAAEYHLKMMAAACANARTMLEFTTELMQAKTFADMVQLSSSYARRQVEAGTDYARRQVEAGTEQAKTLAAAAEKVAPKTASGG